MLTIVVLFAVDRGTQAILLLILYFHLFYACLRVYFWNCHMHFVDKLLVVVRGREQGRGLRRV